MSHIEEKFERKQLYRVLQKGNMAKFMFRENQT